MNMLSGVRLFLYASFFAAAFFMHLQLRNDAADTGSQTEIADPLPPVLTGTSSGDIFSERQIADSDSTKVLPPLPIQRAEPVQPVRNPISLPQNTPDHTAPKQFKYFTRYNSPLFKNASPDAGIYGLLPRNSEIFLSAPIAPANEFMPVKIQVEKGTVDGFVFTQSLGENLVLSAPKASQDELAAAVVQLRCPVRGNFGNGVQGSGVVLDSGGKILTVAHVIEEPVDEGAETCEVFFPLKNEETGVWQARALYKAAIVNKHEAIEDYHTTGRDIAYLQLIPPENNAAPREYSHVPYDFCTTKILGDSIVSIGFSHDISLGALSFFNGEIVRFADIKTISPLSFTHSYNILTPHQYAFAKVKNLSGGGSGGLAFDTDQNCIVGVHSRVGLSQDQTTAVEYIAIP